MAGTAIHLASMEIIEKAKRVASGMLEAAEADIQFHDGHLVVVEQGQVRWVQMLNMPINAVAEAPDGRLWVGAKVGLFWVNPASGAIEAVLRQARQGDL